MLAPSTCTLLCSTQCTCRDQSFKHCITPPTTYVVETLKEFLKRYLVCFFGQIEGITVLMWMITVNSFQWETYCIHLSLQPVQMTHVPCSDGAAQVIEIQSKLQYGCNFQIACRRYYVRGEMCQKHHLIQILWCCRVFLTHTSYCTDMRKHLFGRDPCNNHTVIILIPFLNENENKDVPNHIAIAISAQIIAIRYFFKIVQP